MSQTGLWARKKAITRQSIVESAYDLFLERGYAAVRLEDIADEAVVSVSTLIRYFENDVRESIFFAPELDLLATFEERLRTSGADAVTSWREFIRTEAEHLPFRGNLRRYHEIVNSEPQLTARFHAIRARYEDLIATALAEETGDSGLGPYMFAAALLGGHNAARQRWLASGKPLDVGDFLDVVDYVVDVFRDRVSRSGSGRRRSGGTRSLRRADRD